MIDPIENNVQKHYQTPTPRTSFVDDLEKKLLGEKPMIHTTMQPKSSWIRPSYLMPFAGLGILLFLMMIVWRPHTPPPHTSKQQLIGQSQQIDGTGINVIVEKVIYHDDYTSIYFYRDDDSNTLYYPEAIASDEHGNIYPQPSLDTFFDVILENLTSGPYQPNEHRFPPFNEEATAITLTIPTTSITQSHEDSMTINFKDGLTEKQPINQSVTFLQGGDYEQILQLHSIEPIEDELEGFSTYLITAEVTNQPYQAEQTLQPFFYISNIISSLKESRNGEFIVTQIDEGTEYKLFYQTNPALTGVHSFDMTLLHTLQTPQELTYTWEIEQ